MDMDALLSYVSPVQVQIMRFGDCLQNLICVADLYKSAHVGARIRYPANDKE